MPDQQRTGVSRAVTRVLQALLVVWAAATLVFVLLRLAPGDPYTTRFDGVGVTASQRAVWVAQYGLDQPMPTQYMRWIGNLARGDLGWSTWQQRPVRDVLRDALPNTLLLMGLALCSSILLGMVIGAWQGTRVGTTGDNVVSTASLVAYSLPEFWLALLLIQVFAQGLGWLPSTGVVDSTYDYLSPGRQFLSRIEHLVLPWLALTIVGTAVFARYQRGSVREAWREPFIRTARAKGLGERAVRQHAWRASLSPMITLAGLVFPALLGGAVFVERIFSWPGMGDVTVRAVDARDYDLVTAAVIVGSAMTVIGSLAADSLAQLADPRTRE